MWFEFSAEMTERVEEAEKGNLPIRYYNLKSKCYQGIHSCEGDMVVICNAMADYADLMMEFIRQSDYEGYQKAFYEVHANRCRKISEKLQEQIGYDRNAAIEKCRAKKKYYEQGGGESDNDIGEDAMVLAIKKGRESKKGENNGREDIRGNEDGGPERTGEQSQEDKRV